MKQLWRTFRGDPASEQPMHSSRIMLAILLGGASYLLGHDLAILSAFFSYFAFNMALFIMYRQGIWRKERRWLAATIFDAILAYCVMHHAPEQMAVFYPVLLWMILSNGFRFGINWLLGTAILSTLSFGAVVVSTTYWHQNLTLGLVLTIALLAIPAYCSTLIRNISDAKEEADLASKAKSFFLASVSHELRTPLNAIIGYGNHLRHSNMPRGQKDMVEASVLAGEHLLHLIEQLIDVAKAGTGKTEVKHSVFRPTDLLTEIRDIMTVRVEEKGLKLHLQAEPMSDNLVDGPVSVIRNILLNLVGNAAKFTEAGSITISCGKAIRNNQSALWFAVSDTGIGIADSAKERIFQPFQQADETVMNRFGGTGLGLSICKQLAEQVDGTITVESQLGQGSTFRIDVPLEYIQEPAPRIELSSGFPINILAIGPINADFLLHVQTLETSSVRHISCTAGNAVIDSLDGLDLKQFQIALIAETLAHSIAPEGHIWDILAEADVAPILVSEQEVAGLARIKQTPVYTTNLWPSAQLVEIHSAINIGRAFARRMRISKVEFADDLKTYTPKRILVADDNRTNRNVLAAILEAAGHSVTMATDGDEALIELQKGDTDILLLDVNMPRLNGIDACMRWRETEGSRSRLPIIGVTADATSETEMKCLDAGMDLRITKPVDAQLLLSTIETYCVEIPNQRSQQVDQRPEANQRAMPSLHDNSHQSDPIDRAQIRYLHSIGDQAFVDSMIDGFLEDMEQTIEPLHTAVKSANVAEFRFCAHALKSSGNNMGATSLAQLCGKLEKISDLDFTKHRLMYLSQLEHEIAQAIAALKDDAYTNNFVEMAATN